MPADLVCPPTPTHHARRHCPAAVVSAPPTTNEPRSSPSSLDVLTIAVPTVQQQTEESNVAAGVRHVPTMRLPSIPERAWARALLAPESEEPLPPAWEARMDNHGRIFYIDHATRSTSWQRPVAHGVPVGSSQEPDPHRQQLDRRYQSIRRSIYAERRSQLDDSVPTTSSAAGASPETTGHSHPQACGAASLAEQTSSQRTEHPALLMICRSDYYSMLHANGDAIQLYNRNAALKHMVSRVRRDPRCFGRYQHNRDLVALVNCFASSAGPLPAGWETKLDQSGKQFFIDHTNRHTSFMDPRLPTEGPRRVQGAQGERPVPPPRPPATMLRLASLSIPAADAIPVAYNEKVVAFLRQPNILEILCERHGAAACSRNLREKINAIRVEGTVALDRYSHDLELTILLSLFEDEVMNYVPPRPHSPPINSQPEPSSNGSGGRQLVPRVTSQPVRRDFEAKLFAFHQKLEAKGYGRGPQRLKLVVRRAFVLDDAFQCVMAASKRDLQRGRLCVVWDGEEGLDYGGPSREFFYLLSRRLFNPYHGLYEYSANDIYTVQITPVHHENRRVNYDWYRFSGRVLGLALVHRFLLDAFFTRPFYKALLRSPVALSDLESLDSEFHQSLLWIRDNDVGNGSELGLTFCVTEEPYHRDMPKVELELKPNGRNIIVTERNKRDYLERMIKWRLERGVFAQTEALLRGFYDVVDQRLLSMFDASDLELAISGTVEINARDWRSNTEYRGGYHNGHQVIEWFWIVIDRFTNDQRLRLLQFVTGTSSIPHEGFAGLRGSNGLRRFCVERWDKCDALPRAHTCFNRLDLPPYPTPDILYEKLLMAVEETNTFGIE
ncbi:E3 ubiquitin-protein ligase HECW2 [Anopheles bellator]|uniref:E3 ubiquitin-protein ligase HECW2 n=1 Tax=Anopheles bellator TaxID=139047 RepID=UPI00264A40C6|nr:E3 ubiquitin-protein ligase HECW2 [Anopheles bellator]